MGACDPLFEVFVRLGLFLVHESKEVTSTLVGLVPRRFRWIPYSSVSGKWKKACGIKKRSHLWWVVSLGLINGASIIMMVKCANKQHSPMISHL